MILRPRTSVVALWTIAAWLSCVPALAEQPTNDEEDERLRAGTKLRHERRDAEALAEFEKAYALHHSSRALVQIALAKQALGRLVEAESDLKQALESREDAWIASRLAVLQGALETIQRQLGFLVVETNVSPTELLLDGVSAGPLPKGPLRVTAGPVRIELRTVEHGSVTQTVEVPPGATVVERIRFITRAAHVPEAKVGSTALNREVQSSVEQPARRRIRSPDAALHRGLAYAFAGGATVSLGAAIAAQIIRHRNVSLYNDDRRCLYGELSRDERCGQYRSAAESAQTFGNLALASTFALGTAAAVLFVSLPSRTVEWSVSASARGVRAAGVMHF